MTYGQTKDKCIYQYLAVKCVDIGCEQDERQEVGRGGVHHEGCTGLHLLEVREHSRQVAASSACLFKVGQQVAVNTP